jgi:hypothetical protein
MCSKFGGTSECDALASPAKLKFCTPFPLNFEKILTLFQKNYGKMIMEKIINSKLARLADV